MNTMLQNVPKDITRHIVEKHRQIAERFEKLFQPTADLGYTRLRLMMDLESLADLNLDALLASADGDFGHDVAGILNNMDRSTFPGRLPGWFAPRCGTNL